MRLEVEGRPVIESVNLRQTSTAIRSLRSYGKSSFAALTNERGDYLQVGGGKVTCLLERRDVASGRHFRGYNVERSKVFPDGTILAFGGGEVRLAADEWFTAEEVLVVFTAFFRGEEWPDLVKWRDISHIF